MGNLVLTLTKFVAGIVGMSAAMVADAIHSLSDLISDLIVIVMVRVSSKGIDKSHDYGHGKYETLATAIIAIMLLIAGSELFFSGTKKIYDTVQGTPPPTPRYIALWAALASIAIKEGLYQWTYHVGKRVNSPAMISNAWHHRTDAFSSVASAIGIGGAIALGGQWAILDPIVSCIISVFIIIISLKMILPTIHELTEGSLPEETEQEIIRHIASVDGIKNVHNLKTRHNGPVIILSAHVVVDPDITVAEAHKITVKAENAIRNAFGNETQISIHVEPNEEAD